MLSFQSKEMSMKQSKCDTRSSESPKVDPSGRAVRAASTNAIVSCRIFPEKKNTRAGLESEE